MLALTRSRRRTGASAAAPGAGALPWDRVRRQIMGGGGGCMLALTRSRRRTRASAAAPGAGALPWTGCEDK